MKTLTISLCTAALLTVSAVANAGTIGGASCGSCFGSTYTLTDTPTGAANQYDIFLTIDATGYNQTSTDLLNAVALKLVSSDSEISSVSLLSAPAGYSNPVLLGGLDAGGCSGTLDGYFCDPYTGSGFGKQVAHSGDVYNFEWLLTLTSGSSLLTIDSVKALYVTSAGQQHGITSEDITLTPTPPTATPEPSSLALFGTGILGIATIIRRRVQLPRI